MAFNPTLVNLTTNIPVVNAVSSIRKWAAIDVADHAEQTPPYLLIKIQAYGPGSGTSDPYSSDLTLAIYDSQPCTCARVKAVPQSDSDQLEVYSVTLAGTPYTTLSALYQANTSGTGTKVKRLAALQAGLVAAGALSAEFAGT